MFEILGSVPPAYLSLIGVALGAAISIAGNWVLAKRQSFIQIQTAFFNRRLDTYLKLSEMSSVGYSVTTKSDPGEDPGNYPSAYETFQGLKDWLNLMVNYIDQNRLLLDHDTYRSFNALNHKIIQDLESIRIISPKLHIDLRTRNTGRMSISEVRGLSEAFVHAMREHLNRKYKINLEKVL